MQSLLKLMEIVFDGGKLVVDLKIKNNRICLKSNHIGLKSNHIDLASDHIYFKSIHL